MHSPNSLLSVLETLSLHNISIGTVVVELLKGDSEPAVDNANSIWSNAKNSIYDNIDQILTCVTLQDNVVTEKVIQWSTRHITSLLQNEMCELTKKESGFHFSARTATQAKLNSFDIQEMSNKIQDLAPRLCKLLDVLLEANPLMNYKRNWARQKAEASGLSRSQRKHKAQGKDGDITMDDIEIGGGPPITSTSNFNDENTHWDFFDLEEISLVDNEDDEPEGLEDMINEQLIKLKAIKQVVCVSILMHSTNRSCNTLQSELGIFLHSCGTPETVRELLAHMGLSISTTAINEAISSLSKEAGREIQELGKSLLATYAYDNLDIDLKHSTPTIENSAETLIHITSGTMFPLYHGVTINDLDVGDQLWSKSKFNPEARAQDIPKPTLDDIFNIHAEPTTPHPSGLVRRERFNAWKFLSDLVNNGPDYFRRFKKNLGSPEVIEAIPLVKTRQIPLRCVDVSPSTPAQNADALDSFFRQGGIGDPVDNPTVHPVRNCAIPIAGDLLTCQHVRSLQESRAEESTSWRRGQGMVFIMGLFHLKMACADAIWRIFIHPKASRKDENSLISHVGEIRPKETGKIETKPGFRRMHEVIQHTGIASRLDIWRNEASKLPAASKSLEDFARTKPTWDNLCSMANRMAIEYVAGNNLDKMRARPAEERDKQFENSLLRMQYFLLYEEISHAMNSGDIGRVEICFLPWMMIFAGCGKHKYAAEMQRYLENVHFIYPKSVSRAIRMNILCNPTGKAGQYRALNWVVEHNNLYIKRIYGGKYSNHQKARILAESPLIEVYKNIRLQFENMFCLDHKTTRHSPPQMQVTFKKLTGYMEKERTNIFVKERDSEYSIVDMIEKGINILMARTTRVDQGHDAENIDDKMDVDNPDWAELGDEMEEVDDDGGIDL